MECCDAAAANLKDLKDKLDKFLARRDAIKNADVGGAGDLTMFQDYAKVENMRKINDVLGGSVSEVEDLKNSAHQMLAQQFGSKNVSGFGTGVSGVNSKDDDSERE